ncbi:hypothetical protein CC80DRAFT_556817 [Byssothecium circinans]|uniref:Uncharacterized protein n=1 Tax=Byssothecium circinans TaxID=147558 RepID=A0A6A5UHN8_9PLEO|nr:hypothetical protein CC80DRAFT_556817 [Byssothecium circinans]
MTAQPDAIAKYIVLEITLHAELPASEEDKLVSFLTQFHPRADGTNPHKLQAIKFNVSIAGRVLYTRYRYHLATGVPEDTSHKLSRFLTNPATLSTSEKTQLPFKVHSTERLLARAILGIRGVPNIEVSGRGRWKPGSKPLSRKRCGISQVKRLASVGGFVNGEYDHRATNPYPAEYMGAEMNIGEEADWQPTDCNTLLIGRFMDDNEDDTIKNAVAIAKGDGS